jgi:GWxTD domain-containing protein
LLAALLLAVCSVVPVATLRAVTAKQLPPHYRFWLEQDVPYIISQQERAQFLQLNTDDERDKFIEAFWQARNPDPHSTTNAYEDEHYRRLAYVRDNFGDARYNDGWRTDMGRIYITLGPPKQTAKYHVGIATRPVEIWFYQTPSPALPPYFNIVFYQRAAGDPYTIYSPREDGPTQIVTNDSHSAKDALHTIDQSMGAEATHAMVSLLPDEHINIDDPRPSMDSDILLAKIRSLADQPLEKDRIQVARAAALEKVTTSVFLGAPSTDLETAVTRDAQGKETLNFLLRNEELDPHIVGQLADKRKGYSLTLLTRVMTTGGKAIYQQRDDLAGVVSDAAAELAKQKLFAAEGRLPLVPGDYVIESTLTNELTHEASKTRREVKVPAIAPGQIAISDLMAYRQPSPLQDKDGLLPFSIAGLRFTPNGPGAVQIHAGEQLPLVYQIWFPASEAASTRGAQPTPDAPVKRVHVHYLVGSVGSSAGVTPLEEDEEVEIKNLDAAGNLLTGHTLDTSQLAQGAYRIVVKVTEPGTPRAAYATMTLKVFSGDVPVALWTAYGDEGAHPVWQQDLLRGIAAESEGDMKEAELCYRRALSANADASDARTRLNALLVKPATPSVKRR